MTQFKKSDNSILSKPLLTLIWIATLMYVFIIAGGWGKVEANTKSNIPPTYQVNTYQINARTDRIFVARCVAIFSATQEGFRGSTSSKERLRRAKIYEQYILGTK